MIRVTILEDEAPQLELLTAFLRRFEQENNHVSLKIRSFDRAMNMLDNYRGDTDLLLIDIQLPDMNGMEAARRIREIDSRVMIIFITNLSQYAMEGYSVHAFDYILKPVLYEAFSSKLQLALRMIGHRDQSVWLALKRRGETDMVRSDEVRYIEVQKHDVLVHTKNQVIRVWGTLASFEEQLKEVNFVRCSASFLVNLHEVTSVQGDEAIVGGDRLPVSKSKRKEFLTALARYQGGLQ